MTPLLTKPKLLVLALLTAQVAAAAGFGFFMTARYPEPTSPGQSLYLSNCAGCHGVNLEGQPNWTSPSANGRLPAPPHDASGHTWHHADNVLFQIVKEGPAALLPGGQSDMPAFSSTLTDEEIRSILEFIKSRWPPQQARYQADRTAVAP
jgi:mono/diheme cytochrome c family protein